VIIVLLVWLSFVAIPAASARAQAIRTEALRDAQFGALEPGRFRTFGGGSVVFYAERVDANGILYNVNVFVDRPEEQQQSKPVASAAADTPATVAAGGRADSGNKLEIWVASRAEQRGAGQAEQTFVLYDGYRYEGVPGGGQFRMIRFSEGGIPIQLGKIAGGKLTAATKSTAELLRSTKRDDIAELHWRIAMPVSAVLLMLIAVPLSRLRPRQGRFGKIGIAILVYFLYSRLMVSGRTWIETDAMPSWAGLWWTHGIALVAGLWLLLRENPPGRAKQVAIPAPPGAVN
jgi:lipopolysaccharide export system permease protein